MNTFEKIFLCCYPVWILMSFVLVLLVSILMFFVAIIEGFKAFFEILRDMDFSGFIKGLSYFEYKEESMKAKWKDKIFINSEIPHGMFEKVTILSEEE